MKIIESTQNDYFKSLLKLLKSSGIKKEKQFLMMGSKIVHEVWDDQEHNVKCVLIHDEEQGRDFQNSRKCLLLTKDLFKQLDIFDTGTAILVMDLPEVTEWERNDPEGLELFLPVQDPSNLGAIVRSAAAFGVKKIVLLKECANPYHPKAVKSSSGMVLKMKFESGPSIHELADGGEFLALDQNGKNLADFEWPKNLRFVVGEEGPGLPADLRKNVISIPISRDCESLNVMAATSIALFEYSKK